MKICVFGTRGFPGIEGGVEKHCEMLYPKMAAAHEIIVFRRKPYVKKDEQIANIRFVDLPSTTIKGVEAVIHSFLACVISVFMRPEVVHIHNIGPALFSPLLKLCSIPVVLTYHSPNYEHKKWGFFAKKLLKFCESVALGCADKVIFVNRFQMEKYPTNIREKSEYIPNGIDLPATSDKQDHLERYGLQSGKYILSVGRITPEKGFHYLIDAFTRNKESEYKLVIAGGVEAENGYMKELHRIAGDSAVIFTGAVYGETLAQLYTNAALYVLASENEGFPLVLLEAMSYHLDVLVSDIPATHLVDLQKQDYFPVGDVQNLCEKLKQKMQKPVKREYNLEAFKWDWNVDQTVGIYHEVNNKG